MAADNIAETAIIDFLTTCHDTATVIDKVVSRASSILDYAHISQNAYLAGSSVEDHARISGNVTFVSSRAENNAQVFGNAKLSGSAVLGEAQVYGNCELTSVIVDGSSHVFGNAKLKSRTGLIVTLKGNCKFGGDATFDGLETFSDFVSKYGKENLQETFHGVTLIDVWDMG